MANWTVVFYTTASGSCPVQEYIDELTAREAAKVYEMLSLLSVHGTHLTMPHVRRLAGSNLWELHIRAQGNAH